MVVRSANAFTTPGSRSASSPGPLRAQTGDGRFSIEGEGFLWLQTNSSLFISNRVHTVVQPEFIEPGSSAPRPRPPAAAGTPFEIYSDQFAYSEDSAQGVYQGHVRVSGTNLALTAAQLTLSCRNANPTSCQLEASPPNTTSCVNSDGVQRHGRAGGLCRGFRPGESHRASHVERRSSAKAAATNSRSTGRIACFSRAATAG